MSIRIVTDSTCDLPAGLLDQYKITAVPLYINMGDQSYLDGVEITRREFYERMPNYDPPPTTATPGMDTFINTYENLAADGVSEIISIHISESLSAMVNVAKKAALGMEKIKVTVYDAGQLSLGTGFVVLKAAQLAQEGASVDEIMDIIQKQAQRTHVFAALDTLEYLRRSGRMNKFMAGIGNILQIKPILTMHKGQPGAERVRTRGKAIKRVIQMAEELAPLETIALVHTNAPEAAQRLLQQTKGLFPTRSEPLSVDVTPVLGAHIGPGVVGFALITSE